MTVIRRTCAVLGLGAALLVLQAPGASALSCVEPAEWYPDAEHVFVGRIADVDGRRVQLEVREVWQGEDLAEHVWLRRAEGMNMWYPFSNQGKVVEGYSSPTEYVVAVEEDLVVNPCGLAPADGSGYGVAGAVDPRPPVSNGEEGVEPEPSMAPLDAGGAGLVGLVGLGVLVGFFLRRRRRS